MTFASPAQDSPGKALSPARPRGHIIDVLISERAPKLAATPVWPILRPLLYSVLDYAKAVRMADAIAPMSGAAALDYVAAQLDLKVTARGLERVPATGRAIVICNHPTGIADGIAAYDMLKPMRPDVCFYANADAHRVSPRFSDVLIPVEWVEAKRTRERTRETLILTREAMEAERCLVIFPAGRLARRQPDGELCDPPWQPTAISLARKYEAPVIPMHVSGPWSGLFHFFNRFSNELRDMTLFHEFLNKQGRAYSLTVGPPIGTDALDGDPAEVTLRLKAHVEYGLAADPDRAFA
jgi:putative hemolysin